MLQKKNTTMRKFTKTTDRDWTSQTNSSKAANSHPQTPQHILKKAVSRRQTEETRRGKILVAANAENPDDVKYYLTAAEAARDLGCSKQLVSRAVKGDNHTCSARGYVFRWAAIADLLAK